LVSFTLMVASHFTAFMIFSFISPPASHFQSHISPFRHLTLRAIIAASEARYAIYFHLAIFATTLLITPPSISFDYKLSPVSFHIDWMLLIYWPLLASRLAVATGFTASQLLLMAFTLIRFLLHYLFSILHFLIDFASACATFFHFASAAFFRCASSAILSLRAIITDVLICYSEGLPASRQPAADW